jgi:hypothetical protein
VRVRHPESLKTLTHQQSTQIPMARSAKIQSRVVHLGASSSAVTDPASTCHKFLASKSTSRKPARVRLLLRSPSADLVGPAVVTVKLGLLGATAACPWRGQRGGSQGNGRKDKPTHNGNSRGEGSYMILLPTGAMCWQASHSGMLPSMGRFRNASRYMKSRKTESARSLGKIPPISE